MPNYNNGRYLTDFLQRVIDSSIELQELIIVEDGSEDDSIAILENFVALDFLQTIRFEKNRGLTDVMNEALQASKGKYVIGADPDDLFLPE